MEWKNIKKKSVKTVMLENYVINIKDKYNLSYEQAKCILDQINHAICMKHIQSNHIKTDGQNSITKIEGINFDDNGKIIFKFNKNNNYLSKNKENIYVIESFNGMWNAYKLVNKI